MGTGQGTRQPTLLGYGLREGFGRASGGSREGFREAFTLDFRASGGSRRADLRVRAKKKGEYFR